MGMSMSFCAIPQAQCEYFLKHQSEFEDYNEYTDTLCLEDAWHVLMFLLTEMSFEEDESYHVSSFFYEDEEGDKLECYTVQLSDDTIPFKNAPYDGCMALYQYSVLTISKALEAFGMDNLKARWNSEIFQEAVAEGLIYRGNCWDEEENFVALTDFYNQLVTFFSNAASRGEAVIYYVH